MNSKSKQVTKIAPQKSNISKVVNPIVMTDIEDSKSINEDNVPAAMETMDYRKTDDVTQGVIMATDASVLSARKDDD